MENLMTPTEIAKRLLAIKFTQAQADCPTENYYLGELYRQCDQLPQQDAVRTLFAVIEVLSLKLELGSKEWNDCRNPFKDMSNFTHMEYKLQYFK